MKNIVNAIKTIPLFKGIDEENLSKMIFCINARIKAFKKDEIIIMAGGKIDFVGGVVSGGVRVTREDENGKQNIMTELFETELFGEVFACSGIERCPVTVTAIRDCEILFIDYKSAIKTCSSACGFHNKLVENMLFIIANKNLMLNKKIEILSKRTIRERLILFLSGFQEIKGKPFTIPYNREGMAAFLCVDRSAMSNELSKLRDEGKIDFNKNEFRFL